MRSDDVSEYENKGILVPLRILIENQAFRLDLLSRIGHGGAQIYTNNKNHLNFENFNKNRQNFIKTLVELLQKLLSRYILLFGLFFSILPYPFGQFNAFVSISPMLNLAYAILTCQQSGLFRIKHESRSAEVRGC